MHGQKSKPIRIKSLVNTKQHNKKNTTVLEGTLSFRYDHNYHRLI